MAEASAIAWTKSTFNPWIGCNKISPGCDNCYADALDEVRFSKTLGGGTKVIPIRHWGPGAPRHRTSISYWKQPLRWNRQAPESEFAGRKGFWPVFCASLADVFDNEVPPEWRTDLFALIRATPNLTWLLVTKRIGNVEKMVGEEGLPENVWLLITVVNQEEADRDIPKLFAVEATIRGISYEPALGPINWDTEYLTAKLGAYPFPGLGDEHRTRFIHLLDWIIVGGESTQGGAKARLFDVAWARNTIEQCLAAGVPVFVKQMGSDPRIRIGDTDCLLPIAPRVLDRAGADMAEWPADLRVQEFPA